MYRYLISFKICLVQITDSSCVHVLQVVVTKHLMGSLCLCLCSWGPRPLQPHVRSYGYALGQAQWRILSALLCQDFPSSVTSKSAPIYFLFCFFDVSLYTWSSHLTWHREGTQQMIVFAIINLKSYYPTLLRILEYSCHIAATQ